MKGKVIMMKRQLAVILALALTLSIAGCSGGASSTAPSGDAAKSEAPKSDAAAPSEGSGEQAASPTADPGKRITVAGVLLNTTGEWFTEVINGMQAAADAGNIDLKVCNSNDDVSKEANFLDDAINQQIDAVAVSPINSEASVPAFDRVFKEGIPIVAWNSTLNSENMKYFVGVDNYELGKTASVAFLQCVKEVFGGSAKAGVIKCTKYDVATDRSNGFLDNVKGAEGVDIVAEQEAEFKEDAMNVTENMLQANPEIQIIFCWNQTSMDGCVAALKGANRTDIKVVGVDMAVSFAKDMLGENSILYAVATQQPFEIGYKAVESAAKLARGESVESQVLVPLGTYSSADKEALQKYIDDRKDLVS